MSDNLYSYQVLPHTRKAQQSAPGVFVASKLILAAMMLSYGNLVNSQGLMWLFVQLVKWASREPTVRGYVDKYDFYIFPVVFSEGGSSCYYDILKSFFLTGLVYSRRADHLCRMN